MNPLKIGFAALIIAATLVPVFDTPADAKRNRGGWGNQWGRHDNGRHLGWWRGRGHQNRRFINNPVVYPRWGYQNYWNNNNNWRYRNHRGWW
jgi:hypothetical protein